jgi:hypothetical protein
MISAIEAEIVCIKIVKENAAYEEREIRIKATNNVRRAEFGQYPLMIKTQKRN